MPEGPEIRRAADRIAAVLVGNTVVEVELALPAIKRHETSLTGARVTSVDTHGKAMLTRFDNGLTLYSHNQLYGRWYTTTRPRLPKTSRQLRVALHTRTRSALLYSASDIDVLTPKEVACHPFLSRLGPDVLDRSLDADAIVDRLREKRFRRRSVAALYLDQSFLAGLGNYLRSEILWAARVQPKARPDMLSVSAIAALARQTIVLSRRSYRTRGLTVAPALAKRLEDEGLSFGRRRFYVFGREGEACSRTAPQNRGPSGRARWGHWVSQRSAWGPARCPERESSSALAILSTQMVRALRSLPRRMAKNPGAAPVDITR